MAKEIELKYAAPLRFDPRYLFCHDLVGKYRKKMYPIMMHTRYLDTKDGDFAKRGITLRQRMEDGESYIYAKSTEVAKDGFSVRNEWRTKSRDLETAAKRLAARGAPTRDLIGVPIIVTGEVEFDRLECRVIPHEGFEYMLTFDKGFFNGIKPFAEMELELICGSQDELIETGNTIAASLRFAPEMRSKHERALLYR